MRAAISEEWLEMIDEKIYLDLELHILNDKLIKAESEGKEGFARHLESIVHQKNAEVRGINSFFKEHGIRVQEVEKIDDMFVQYWYSAQGKEGFLRYWKAAIKLKLKRRLNTYFT